MSDIPDISIAGRAVGPDHPTYVIAEISSNHLGDRDRALRLIEAAAASGADAIKLQTYRADTMTLDADGPPFRIGPGTIWEGRRLYALYEEAATPWEWHPDLAKAATAAGMHWFSSPFDASAVDFLEALDAPAYKIASFEAVDLPLIRRVAATGKPVIISTGMSQRSEIEAAVSAARGSGGGGVALMRCNSAYPAPPDEMDLRTIPDMQASWHVPVGLSDHTLGIAAAVAAVALGARLIEKHVTLARTDGGPDAQFSAEPDEFAMMVAAIRDAERALGGVRYGPTAAEEPSLTFRRSLWVIRDVLAGEVLSSENVRALRPAGGLAPDDLERVLGKRARVDIPRATPLTRDLIS